MRTLLSIVETTISPELLPASDGGEIEQSTEATLGPFELHDFILYHAVRCGYPPEKIVFLSQFATFTQAVSPASCSCRRSRPSTNDSFTINSSDHAFPTAPRSAPSASLLAVTGGCPRTQRPLCGSDGKLELPRLPDQIIPELVVGIFFNEPKSRFFVKRPGGMQHVVGP